LVIGNHFCFSVDLISPLINFSADFDWVQTILTSTTLKYFKSLPSNKKL